MESNSRNRMDEILHDKLANVSLDADGISWDDFQNRKNKKRFIWWWFSGAAAIAVILVFMLLPQNVPVKMDQQNAASVENVAPNTNSENANSNTNEVKPASDKTVMIHHSNSDDREKENTQNGIQGNFTHQDIQKMPEQSIADAPYTDESQSVNPVYENAKQYQSTLQTATEIFKQAEEITQEYSDSVNKSVPEIIAGSAIPKTAETTSDKEDLEKLKIKGMYFQLQAGANLNYPKFFVTQYGSQFIHKNYEGIRKNSEKGMWGYSLQLNAGKEIGKFAIETGLGFTFMEVAADYQFSYSEKPIRDMGGKIIGYNATSPEWIQFKNTHKYYFADIPLTLKYTVFESPNNIFRIKSGVIAQIMNGVQGSLPDAVLLDQRENLRSENFKSFSTALDFGLEYGWKKGEKNQWILAPYYRKNLGLDQVQSLYKMRFNYFGFALSYRRSL